MKLARLLLSCSILAVPALASAAADPTAHQLFVAGQQAYDAGRFDVAVKAFEEAQALAPSDLLTFDLAQCHRKKFLALGERAALDKAVELYRQFLATPAVGRERAMASDAIAELLLVGSKAVGNSLATPNEAKAQPGKTEIMLVTEAPQALVALDDQAPSPAPVLATVTPGEHHAHVSAPGYFPGEARVFAVEGRFVVSEIRLKPQSIVLAIAGKSGSTLQVDGVTVGTLPMEHLEVTPGHHRLTTRRRGYQSWEQDLEVAPGTRLQLRPELYPTARRRALRWTGLGAGLFGAAATASGIVWGTQYASPSDYLNRPGHRTKQEVDAYSQQLATIDQARIWTSLSVALGGSLLIATLTLYWLD